MNGGIRSFFSFVLGLFYLTIGAAALLAELTPLSLVETLSIGSLVAGALLLVAVLASPRRSVPGPGRSVS